MKKILGLQAPTRKSHNLGTNISLHSSSSVNGEDSTPKDPLYKILDELRPLNLWKEKKKRKEKGREIVNLNFNRKIFEQN